MAIPESLQNLRAQILAWSPVRRTVFATTAVGSLLFFLWLGFGAVETQYAVLYRGLAGDEMAEVVEALDAAQVSYRFDDQGQSIRVPADRVHEMRIRLAGNGLPRGGGAGFELFDQADFGVTDFVHRVNYRRALQGELARSIAELDPVARARVQIALPERTPFVGNGERQPSASVVVDLRPGADLGAAQIRGIVHLVSASVEGLANERVTIVDGRGRLLAPAGDDLDTERSAGGGEHQRRLEQDLSERIEAILVPAVGPGRVVARVRADLDWTQVEQTEERYDPDSQVERSEQRSSESDRDGGAIAAGPPGAVSNVPGEPGADGAEATTRSTSRTSETINYEISKTVRRSVEAPGSIDRLSVAILIDGKPGGAEGFEPWEPEALANFEELAKRAVGFAAERGDELEITNAPFRALEGVEPIEEPWLDPDWLALLATAIRGLLALVSLVAFAFLVVRPLARALATGPSPVLPARVADLEAQLAGAGAPGGRLASGTESPAGTQASSAELARLRAEESVRAIQGWLQRS